MVNYDQDVLTGSFYYICVEVLVWFEDFGFCLVWDSDWWLFLYYLAGVTIFIEIFQQRL